MASSSDVRDMLGLPTGAQPRPVKKQKKVEKKRESWVTREMASLMGERTPPIAIGEPVQFKPKINRKANPWERRGFQNPARNDGLVLYHWRMRNRPKPDAKPVGEDGPDQVMADGARSPEPPDSHYHYAKFNVKVEITEYNEQEYDGHLRDDDWSKEETDYLLDLCRSFDLRWVVIADRYEYDPARSSASAENNEDATVPIAKQRSMEDMKARYYSVAAKIMALRRPLSTMSQSEYDRYETLTKFDPVQETQRKKIADQLLHRKPEEVKEEEMLLGELQRIVTNEERFLQERKALYARLDAQQSTGNTTMYQSSQGLNQLFQTLLTADKSKKRRSLMDPKDAVPSPITAASGQQPGGQATPRDKDGHRESISGGVTKKGPQTPAVERRKLTPREEEMYGVTHHERIASGVHFRHDKVTKLAQAKSNVQAQRVSAALTELEIPPRLVMPTAKVCAEYERLIQSIHTLTEVRKVSERVETEIKIALVQKEEREKRERTVQGEGDKQGEEDNPGEMNEQPDAVMDDAPPVDAEAAGEAHASEEPEVKQEPPRSRASSSRPTTAGDDHKRSASVLSDKSAKSSYSTRSTSKRQRK
ncbi:MAG: swr complex subunit [Piccolia ochrophora]|nr:MAG: swr complex subunit [Piccolia ochrophora]